MRMYWPAVFVLAVAAATPTRAVAQEQAGAAKAAAAVDAAVGTGVADRALAGAAESFSASVGKLYCFSKIENAADSEIGPTIPRGQPLATIDGKLKLAASAVGGEFYQATKTSEGNSGLPVSCVQILWRQKARGYPVRWGREP